MRFAIAILALIVAVPAAARDDGRWAGSPDKSWVESLHSKNGAWCCNDADGQRIEDADWRSNDGDYQVRLNGAWVTVPDGALITDPNRIGTAIVWPYRTADGTGVRCFLPGAGT